MPTSTRLSNKPLVPPIDLTGAPRGRSVLKLPAKGKISTADGRVPASSLPPERRQSVLPAPRCKISSQDPDVLRSQSPRREFPPPLPRMESPEAVLQADQTPANEFVVREDVSPGQSTSGSPRSDQKHDFSEYSSSHYSHSSTHGGGRDSSSTRGSPTSAIADKRNSAIAQQIDRGGLTGSTAAAAGSATYSDPAPNSGTSTHHGTTSSRSYSVPRGYAATSDSAPDASNAEQRAGAAHKYRGKSQKKQLPGAKDLYQQVIWEQEVLISPSSATQESKKLFLQLPQGLPSLDSRGNDPHWSYNAGPVSNSRRNEKTKSRERNSLTPKGRKL
ncbi:hypothetical protein PCASD_10161 [Puccinia coronata f. sp. avenae]|uniref:Uncharacterized protein n=1 Tax=Puccinia coronata f. sp. avenae TaxID=200324 RepID=A0A2N5UGQ8_9BASI|nr:hypothetical protein PCASD_10161 [Puccinia coronata f. sp. avenae]